MARYWEDYNVGEKCTTPKKTITATAIDIINSLGGFIEPLFLDHEFVKTTVFGEPIAPGVITVLMMGGLEQMVEMWDIESAIALTGLNNIRFLAPLKAGDTIRVEMEITQKTETKRADRGIIVHKSVCKNQRDEVIAEMETVHLMKRRA